MSKPTKYCPNCGAEIDQKARICPKCGVEQPLIPGVVKKHTRAWYLVPLILGIIGGIIGYIVIKDDDKKMATNLLIIGIIMTVVIPIVVGLVVWTWLTDVIRGGLTGLTTSSLLVDEEAPLFTLTDINGANFSLDDFRGKVVVLDFFATWCGPCKTQMPHLSQICEKYNNSKVVVISISVDPRSDTVEKLKQFASDNNMTWIVARDTAGVAKNYGVTPIPTLFIIDQKGIVRYVHVGLTPASTLSSEIDSLLEQ